MIAKWKKPGYEKLCSTYVINPKNYKFGTVSICRVPKSSLAPGTTIEDPITGCRGCASGLDCEENIFGNKYGQDLAGIQIAREERSSMIQNMQGEEEAEDQEEEEEQEQEQEEDSGPVGAADGSSGRKSHVWRDQQEEEDSSASKKHRVE